MLGLTKNEEGGVKSLDQPSRKISFRLLTALTRLLKISIDKYFLIKTGEYQDFCKIIRQYVSLCCVLENSLIFRWQRAISAAKPIFVTRLLHSIRQQHQLPPLPQALYHVPIHCSL